MPLCYGKTLWMPSSKPHHHLDMSDARALLKSHDLRCTTARVSILRCLSDATAPQEAASIAAELESFGFDQSTIYRALTDLAEAGLVARLEVGDGPRHFELAPDAGGASQPHSHFFCTECHRVFCLTPAQVSLKKGGKQAPLPGTPTEILIKGRCTNCH